MDVADMNDVQKKALEEFKSKNESIIKSDPERYDDFYLSRWLVAAAWNVDDAQELFTGDLKWREESQIASKIEKWSSGDNPKRIFLEKYYPTGIVGNDKRGGPVYMERIGKFDQSSLLKCVTPEEYTLHHLYQIEKGEVAKRHAAKKSNNLKLRKHVVILDIEGIGWDHLNNEAIELTKSIIKLDETHYPEGMIKMYIINAPWIFNQIWKLIKPWISERTAKKIEICGHDYLPKLLEVIDADQIPVQFGGKGLVVGDGGKVPESYYMPTAAPDVPEKPVECWVPRAGHSELRVAVRANDLFKYEFWSIDYDVAFGISFLARGATDRTVVQPIARYDSHLSRITGTAVAPGDGSLVAIFDNSFSTFRKKQVFYKIGVPTAKGAAQVTEGESISSSSSTASSSTATAPAAH